MALKTCTYCHQDKPLEQFPRRYDAPNAKHRTRCKACAYKINNEKYYEKMRKAQDAWRLRNRASVNRQAKERRNLNPEKARASAAKWVKNNPHRHREEVSRRNAKIRGATPSWADRGKILEIYKRAHFLTQFTGVRHDVDHIIPIISNVVCGLHVETNLQILTVYENARKSNRFDLETQC